MDDRTCDSRGLHRTLRDFKIINVLLSRARGLLKRYLIPHMLRHLGRPLTVLDIGSGGSDIPLWLSAECARNGLDVRVICLDSDARAVAYARAASANVPSVSVVAGDAFRMESLVGRVDYVIANHFLHHLSDREIPEILAIVDRCAARGFLLSDVKRSSWSFIGFSLVAALLWRGGFTLSDGRLSICKGFTREELTAMAARAGLADTVRVSEHFPARLCLVRLCAN